MQMVDSVPSSKEPTAIGGDVDSESDNYIDAVNLNDIDSESEGVDEDGISLATLMCETSAKRRRIVEDGESDVVFVQDCEDAENSQVLTEMEFEDPQQLCVRKGEHASNLNEATEDQERVVVEKPKEDRGREAEEGEHASNIC